MNSTGFHGSFLRMWKGGMDRTEQGLCRAVSGAEYGS